MWAADSKRGRIVPMSESLFARILMAFGLPTAFLFPFDVLQSLTEFECFDRGYGLYVALGNQQLAISYDPATETTNAIR